MFDVVHILSNTIEESLQTEKCLITLNISVCTGLKVLKASSPC